VIWRALDEQRPMSFSRASAVLSLSEAGEFMYVYLFTIDDPSGHEVSDLSQATARAQERLARMDLPAEYRSQGHEASKREKELGSAWKAQAARDDARLMTIRQAEPDVQALCEAVNRQDERVVQASTIPPGDKTLWTCQKILGAGHSHIALDYVAFGYSGG